MKSICPYAFLFLFPFALNASIIFTPGNIPSDDVNILLTLGATGTTVTSSPNVFPAVIVDFSSSQSLSEPASWQAQIAASPEGSPLTNLTISFAGGLPYGDLIINPFIGGLCPNCTGGASTIAVRTVSTDAAPETPAVFTGLTVGNGNNFLAIAAPGSESVVSTRFSLAGGVNDLRQPRISGPFAVQVPITTTYSLIGVGLGLLGILSRRRFRSTRLPSI